MKYELTLENSFLFFGLVFIKFVLPRDTLLLDSFLDSGQHWDDYTVVTSQFHHVFPHIPPPMHKKR